GLEYRLHIAVETTLCFLRSLVEVEAELDFDVELLEALLQRHVGHQPTLERSVVVLIRPLVHAHLAARAFDAGRVPLRDGLAVTQSVDREGGLMPVLDCPDDVLGALSGVAAEEYSGPGRLKGRSVDHRHVPFVELDTDIALDPGEGILLPDRQNHI